MNTLSGSLTHFMPLQILRLLQQAGATGRIEFRSGEERADVFLQNGRSAFAFTNAVHLRVGDVLVNGGDIRSEAVELTAAVQQDQPGTRLGAMLVESGIVHPDRLREAVLEVQRRIICRVLLWHEGEFAFYPGEVARDEDITLDLDMDRLIVQALHAAAVAESRLSDLAA